MRIVFKKNLPDGRRIIVYDEGGGKKVLHVSEWTVSLKNNWDWEEEVIKKLGITKKDLEIE